VRKDTQFPANKRRLLFAFGLQLVCKQSIMLFLLLHQVDEIVEIAEAYFCKPLPTALAVI